jgi:ketosteroid isomerase-like protein
MKMLTLLPVLAALGCAAAPSIDLDAERTTLLDTDRQWLSAVTEGRDVERIVSFWAEDAVVIPPGLPPVVGREALKEYVRSSLAIPGFSIAWEPNATEYRLSPDGQMAYAIEGNRVTFQDAKGDLVTVRGRSVAVWRKDAAGNWKCAVDIWNDEPPARAGS